MNNLIKRSITGSVYVTVVVLSLIVHPLLFPVLIVFFNLQSLRELWHMSVLSGHSKGIWILINSLLLAVSLYFNYFGAKLQLQIAPLIVLMIYLFVNSLFYDNDRNRDFLLWSILGSVYITLPLMLLTAIHFQSLEQYIPFALLVFILIWINDTFAYVFGITLGRHRLFERISPKKSWEGFFGGLIMSIAASLLLSRLYPDYGLVKWLFFGFLTVLSAVLGDLIESMLKRSVNVKDSGSMLPGHGGVLDRIDSLLLVSPVIYLYLLLTN